MAQPVRKLLAGMAVVVLLAPAAGELCVSALARHCAASQHACCEGPRVAQCDCVDPDGSRHESEPAQRSVSLKADNTLIALEPDRPRATAQSSRAAWLEAAAPPGTISERLSLLSTLLI